MRLISTIVLLVLFSSLLEASYMRSIRVGSFLKSSAAATSLKELNRFIDSSYRLSDLRNEFNFKVKTIRSGRYYVTVIEPVTDRRAVQEILDIVRTVYPHAYPKKIKHPSRAYSDYKPQPVYTPRPAPIQHRYTNIEPEESGANYLKEIEKIDNLIEEEVPHRNIKHREVMQHRQLETSAIHSTVPTSHPMDQTLQHPVHKEEVVHKRLELKRRATLEPEEKEETSHDEPFSIFGYEISMIDFSKISMPEMNFDFNLFHWGEEEVTNEHQEKHQIIANEEHQKNLSVFEQYKLEILIVLGFFFIIIALKLFSIYRSHKEDQISIQDIYN